VVRGDQTGRESWFHPAVAAYDRTRTRARGASDVWPSGSLRVRVFAGYDSVTGRRNYLIEHIRPGPNAEDEAEAALVRLLEVNERRNPRTKATLNQLLDKYLEVANLDPGTLRGYQRNYKNHVKPLIGSKKVAEVDAHLLDSFYAELRRCRKHCDGTKRTDGWTDKPHECDKRCKPHECEGLAPSTVRRVHFLLSGALSRAVKWNWVTTGNPASAAEPPPEPTPDPQPPTLEESARIVNEAWKDPDWGTLVWLAMTTGARRAELCALRWRHVNLTLGTISVRRSVDQNGAETTEKDTKTHQHRRIALDPQTMAVLSEHKERWAARASSLGSSLSEEAFVFSLTPDGSESMNLDTVTQRYGRLAERLGIATTIHKLRHFSATELIAAGVDPRTVGGRLGHAGGGSTTLRVYSAWVAESGQRAATMLSARMPERPPSLFETNRWRYLSTHRPLMMASLSCASGLPPRATSTVPSSPCSTSNSPQFVALIDSWARTSPMTRSQPRFGRPPTSSRTA
jgi:integrase